MIQRNKYNTEIEKMYLQSKKIWLWVLGKKKISGYGAIYRSGIARNGLYVHLTPDSYFYYSTDEGFEVRFGDFIFRVGVYGGNDGIWKSTNGGSTFTS